MNFEKNQTAIEYILNSNNTERTLCFLDVRHKAKGTRAKLVPTPACPSWACEPWEINSASLLPFYRPQNEVMKS